MIFYGSMPKVDKIHPPTVSSQNSFLEAPTPVENKNMGQLSAMLLKWKEGVARYHNAHSDTYSGT